jgi:hypothetical protein
MLVSEHLAWSAIGGAYLNDLLPLPYTEESLGIFCQHVDKAQGALDRRLLIENPSSYLRYWYSPIPEPEFMTELAPGQYAASFGISRTFASCSAA